MHNTICDFCCNDLNVVYVVLFKGCLSQKRDVAIY